MMASQGKKSVKNVIVRPFAFEDDSAWTRLNYRHDPAESWRNAMASPLIILPSALQDARRDALHEFDIELNVDSLKQREIDLSNLQIVILVRDNFSKKVVILKTQTAMEPRVAFIVEASQLEETSLTRRIEFEVMLCAKAAMESNGLSIRRSARLTKKVIAVSTESQGFAFNFSKATAAEFIAKGLPATTTFYVEFNDSMDLAGPCDDVSSILRVLVHEDAWMTLQEIRGGDQFGEGIGAMFISELLCAVLSNAKVLGVAPDQIEMGSVLHRIFDWLAGSEYSPEDVAAKLLDDEGLSMLQSQVQASLKLTRLLKKIRLGQEDQL